MKTPPVSMLLLRPSNIAGMALLVAGMYLMGK
jgi:hypothetical protein